MKDCIPWEGPYAGAEEECKEERAAEMKCYGLTATPITHPSVLLGLKEVEELEWSEVS